MINYKLNYKIKTFLIILLLTLSNNAFAQFSAPPEAPEAPKQKPELRPRTYKIEFVVNNYPYSLITRSKLANPGQNIRKCML